MKRIKTFFLLFFVSSVIFANEWETYEVISRLMTIREAGAPVIINENVIFTADSGHRRVGVAFAHEDFKKVYWFTRLMVPQDRQNLDREIQEIEARGNARGGYTEQESKRLREIRQNYFEPLTDAGIQFYVYQLPENLKELGYRLIFNGLWTVDHTNPLSKRDPDSGLQISILTLPVRPPNLNPVKGLPDGLNFTFEGPPGETVTVAGSFNNWDPFMYELKEGPAGTYKLTLPLPPGTYQYVFFHRGQRHIDPNNGRRTYARDGSAASEVIIPPS